jgi:hypothetical protein
MCEGGAAGPPFGVVKPKEDFALGPALSRSPCPLSRPLRLTTTVTDPDPSSKGPTSPIASLHLSIIRFSLSPKGVGKVFG